ncbi:MAG: ExeA family protein, partial [Gammaproteobacteria bacterium]
MTHELRTFARLTAVTNMYTKYFGLDKAPFRITPDPEFFFSGGNRGAVLEALLYAVSRGEGIVKVVGEVGSGKTMLCRMLERELPDDCDIVYLANPRLSPDEILHAIAVELELDVARDAAKLDVMRVLHGYLLEKHARNRRVVMFIEEAQGMALDTLEEIRMLSNLETTQDKLLQIVLFGQPELNDKLAAHEIRQLRERITYSFDLMPLNRAEIRDYLNTRIRTSGFRGNNLFSAGAIRALERRSRGLLRRINILADKALLAAFARGERQVRARHVRMAARDSEFSRQPFVLRPARVLAGVLLALLAVGSGWLGAQSFGWRNMAQGLVAPEAVTAPVAIVELAGVNGILSDDGHTIADDMLGGATAGVPVAR